MFSYTELRLFEKLFGMDSGYVLDFTNDLFQDFIHDSIGINIYEENYVNNVKEERSSSSKANILRYIWKHETPELVLKLNIDLVEYYEWNTLYIDNEDKQILSRIKLILNNHSNSELISKTLSGEHRIIDLIEDINKSISDGKCVFALDRLHTLLHNILRDLCHSHKIQVENKDRVDQLFKKYTNFLKNNEYIESKMASIIFRNMGSILSEYNSIRNHKSYAHDNEILTPIESSFILKNAICILKFIKNIDNNFDFNKKYLL